jgi:methylated-DNA-[protein]-cysteine S-methyltransferase
MPTLFLHEFKTRLGVMRSASTDKQLVLLTLPDTSSSQFHELISDRFPKLDISKGGKINVNVEMQIALYCKGTLKKFSIPFLINGTPFQSTILKQVARIPYGKTESYGEVAAKSGFPRAFRAVGTVMSTNSLPLVIPCHRVVASNGIGGYGGGLEMKKTLLQMEGVRFD